MSGTGYADLCIEEPDGCEIVGIVRFPVQNTQVIGIGTSLSFRHTV